MGQNETGCQREPAPVSEIATSRNAEIEQGRQKDHGMTGISPQEIEQGRRGTRLNEAIALAAKAHDGQVDKAGRPYILHVLRVMLACQSDDDRIAAALHDVVEDCGFTVDDLRPQFGDYIADAVDALSRRQGEAYEAFVTRCAANPIARAVKLADLADNMDQSRLGRVPTMEDGKRMARYAAARALLSGG